MKNADQGDNSILTKKPDQDAENIFEGTISFIRKRSDYGTKVFASFLQRSTQNGFFSVSPSLAFCAIIPDNSEIFALVEKGDLKGIITRLQQGKASLSDCDSKGRTLLNVRKSHHEFLQLWLLIYMKYALYHSEDAICEFLIGKGADVDAMEPKLGAIYEDEDYVT